MNILAEAPWESSSGTVVTAVRTFLTAPQGSPYLIVRVETSQPGLYGLGCASDPQRTLAVNSVLEDYLAPMVLGRDPGDIDDIHRLLLNSGYWRGGSIEGNALGAIDLALWDIKAKAAGMPLYSLLGGRVRDGVAAYTHVDGGSAEELAEGVEVVAAQGFRHVRVQAAVPGSLTYGVGGRGGSRWDSEAYVRFVPGVLREVRSRVPDEIALLHDAHERLTPAQARRFVADVADARLFFLEDVLAPEDAGYFGDLRSSGVPLAMGELFHDVARFLPLVTGRLIDFARVRVPTLGGLTPVRKLAAVCEMFGVRLAPHGPGDVSPLGHAANVALGVSSHAFGIQEAATLREATFEVFPGTPVPDGGVLRPSSSPGLGVDFDEAAARRYPPPEPGVHDRWALLRASDGAVHRP